MHRVQRVPETEASGRIHTSTATVAVLPKADEVDVHIDEARDLRIDVKRSSGPGGQSVNTTDSAVRITHLPTGLVVEIQDEKSQHKNKAKAMAVLRSRLLELEQRKAREEEDEVRRSMVGSGERSEKIRTYNFPQDRITDHRIGLDVHDLPGVLDGDLDRLIDALDHDRPGRAAGLHGAPAGQGVGGGRGDSASAEAARPRTVREALVPRRGGPAGSRLRDGPPRCRGPARATSWASTAAPSPRTPRPRSAPARRRPSRPRSSGAGRVSRWPTSAASRSSTARPSSSTAACSSRAPRPRRSWSSPWSASVPT